LSQQGKKAITLTGLVLCLSMLSFPVSAQVEKDDKKVIDDTRQAYSILRHMGVSQLTASVVPNWDPFFVGIEPAQRAGGLKLANKLRFTMTANANGAINVTHTVVGARPNKATIAALNSIAQGIELSVTGFLMSWMPFMMTHLIPEELDRFVLQDLGEQYVLTFKEGPADVTLTMTKDLEITELKTALGTVRPQLIRTRHGFVLTGYEGDNESQVSGHIVFKATVTSQPVSGMQLPSRLVLNGTVGGTPLQVDLGFTNYQLKTTAGGRKK
jgi:hypothetical protein